MTTPADLAPFTPEDLDEPRSRLERLAQLWRLRLGTITPEELDRAEGDAYTPREMASAWWGRRTTRMPSANLEDPTPKAKRIFH